MHALFNIAENQLPRPALLPIHSLPTGTVVVLVLAIVESALMEKGFTAPTAVLVCLLHHQFVLFPLM